MAIHHFAPHAHRHSPCSFLFPGNLLDLQPTVWVGIKHSAAEQKQQRHFAVFERIEVFRGRDVQVKRARDSKHGFGPVGKGGDNAVRMRQQSVAQGLPPIFRPAEQLAKFLFLARRVCALWRLNLYLRMQHDALNFVSRCLVDDLDLEMQQRRQPTRCGIYAKHFEIEIRHLLGV